MNTITLSEFNQIILDTLETKFKTASYWVIADVTDHGSRNNNGYTSHYFELVEKNPVTNKIEAKLKARAFGRGSKEIEDFEKITGQRFTNDINVLIRLTVDFHTIYGLSGLVIEIDSKFTLGRIAEERLRTLSLLVEQNNFISFDGEKYITKNNQLKVPKVIQNIAVIGSKTSAGLEDFLHTLNNNEFNYKFEIQSFHSTVQGKSSSTEIVEKLIEIFNFESKFDIVVITRGGGGQNDFITFDDYKLSRAVAKFPIPIITGIGHQKDQTIIDMMSKIPVKSPTKAAEYIISQNRNFEESIISIRQNVVVHSQKIIGAKKDKLNIVRNEFLDNSKNILYNQKENLRLLFGNLTSEPKIIINTMTLEIVNIAMRLKSNLYKILKNENGYINHYKTFVRIMTPENILKKGFAIVKQDGRIVSNFKDTDKNDIVEVILSSATIKSKVLTKTKTNE